MVAHFPRGDWKGCHQITDGELGLWKKKERKYTLGSRRGEKMWELQSVTLITSQRKGSVC